MTRKQQTASWVSQHSQENLTDVNEEEAELIALQATARRLIQNKLRNRTEPVNTKVKQRATSTSGPPEQATEEEIPRSGVQHLKKLELIPETAGGDHSTDDEEMASGNNNHYILIPTLIMNVKHMIK